MPQMRIALMDENEIIFERKNVFNPLSAGCCIKATGK